MGYGSYSSAAHQAMTSKRAQAGQEVFAQRSCHDAMNPKGLTVRESRDSDEHPNSVGVIFALDVSGSMGNIPRKLASDTLPHFMSAIIDAGVPDPQIMFMGVGCAQGDRAPLQVGQFESTESLMDQWLTWMYLEGGGGGGYESYEMAMYFAARHTSMDCYEKRGRRGYLFITGDEPPNSSVFRGQVKRVIGDELDGDVPIRQIIDETAERFEVFYLIPEPGRDQSCGRQWRDLLGDHVIVMESPDDTGHAAAGIVSLLEGAVGSLDELVARLRDSDVEPKRCAAVARALTPFAASLGKDGAPSAELAGSELPEGAGESGYDR